MKAVGLVILLCAYARETPLPPNAPEQILAVGGLVQAPRLPSRTTAGYSRCRAAGKATGIAILEMIVDADGRVREPRLLTTIEPCASSAMLDAARTRRFAPATLRGKPVAVRYNVSVTHYYE